MSAQGDQRTVSRTGDADLLPLVRRYLERNLRARERQPERVRFTQTGEMQLKPGRWLSFSASQEMWVERVEFAWRARFPIAPLVSLRVVDWYRRGGGGLQGKLWGLVPLLRAGGHEIAKAEAMRYLAELAWVPHAMLANRELELHQVDDATVEVATRVAAARVPVQLHFDTAGDIVGASAAGRPRMVGKASVETPFRGCYGDYQVVGGVRVPTTAEVAWKLPDGPFTYFRGRLVDLEFD